MNRRMILIFIIIILMPITVITVMVFNTYTNRMTIEEERLKDSAAKQLTAVDRLIQNSFRTIERSLKNIQIGQVMSADELRGISNKEKLIKQLFIIDIDNKFIFPPEEGELSRREEDFLAEAVEIELISALQARISPTEKNELTSGWYTWFMGDGINFIYFDNKNNELKGFFIERYALISELINVLPDSDNSNMDYRVILYDARGNILYQWGNYLPPESQLPLSGTALSAPLGSWRFQYYQALNGKEKDIINLKNYMIIFGLTAMTIMILFLSYYFYKENSRTINIARRKVSFVNQVSHELKTPLTNIRLYSELLQKKLTDKKELEYLDIIINEGSRLGRLINNVLIFGKGERGELKQRIEKIDLNSLIREVLEKFDPLLKENHMKTDFQERKLPEVETDADMIEQIIANIVGNAVKYGSSGK